MFYKYESRKDKDVAVVYYPYKKNGKKLNNRLLLGEVIDKEKGLFKNKEHGMYHFSLVEDTTNIKLDTELRNFLIGIDKKRNYYVKNNGLLDDACRTMIYHKFACEYHYESLAMEGSPLSHIDIALMFYDDFCLSPAVTQMKFIYEAINHRNAFHQLLDYVDDGTSLTKDKILNLHKVLMRNIFDGGKYRDCDVYIENSNHPFPGYHEVPDLMKTFYMNLKMQVMKEKIHPIVLAAWTHAEFVGIHPFMDGNGRTSRLLMNYQLIKGGYWPISISLGQREEYSNALNCYATTRNLVPLVRLFMIQEDKYLDQANEFIESAVQNSK